MGEKIGVVIIDDHPLFRDGVVQTLGSEIGFEVLAEGNSAEDALRSCQELLPEILLLDISIPGGGLPAAQAIHACCPVTRIVMLTASDSEDNLLAAFKAGARAYILKGVSSIELVRILRAVWSGESYVPPHLAATLLADLTARKEDAWHAVHPLEDLTERERQILDRVAKGHSNKEIANEFFLSEKTVKHHMTNILQKLQVRNRVEAAMLAKNSFKRPEA